MAEVEATQLGYYGGELRPAGSRFSIPDKVMADDKLRPSWVVRVGGWPKVADTPDMAAGDHDDGLEKLTVPELRALAKDRDVTLGAETRTKADIINALRIAEASPDAPAEPFADAPAPVTVTNEINDAHAATQPDWVAPGADI